MLFKSLLLISLFSLFWWRTNIISMLISLELLLLSCFMALSWSYLSSNLFIFLLFLSLMVSGSALGLSLLVLFSRLHSSSSLFIDIL